MQSMEYEFRLFGGRMGTTMSINGHKFVDGVFRTVIPSTQLPSLAKILSYYGAFLKGSSEYDAAMAAETGGEPKAEPKVAKTKAKAASEPLSEGNGEIAAALKKLDPENDDHWVMTGTHKGLPKLFAVEEAYGRAGLTRQDLEAALPGWNRDKALEAALEG